MLRRAEELLRGAEFHDLPRVHQRQGVAHGAGEFQVVGDDEAGASGELHELHQGLDHLPADEGVQPLGGLVGDAEGGLAPHGHGGEGPLLHAAAELMRVFSHDVRRVVEGEGSQDLQGMLLCLLLREAAADLQGFHELGADLQHRVQGLRGVLVDIGDLFPPDGADFLPVHGRQVLPLKEDVAGGDGGGGQKPEDGLAQDALAAAGLPHQAYDLP